MLRTILFNLCALMVSLPAAVGLVDVTVTLPPGVAPESVKVEFLPDRSKKEIPCILAGRAGADPMYECNFELEPQSAGVFIFRMAGYQPVSVRAASLQPSPGEVAVRLGRIHAANSDEPRIDTVIKTVEPDGALRFQIMANNQSRQAITVTQMQMDGSALRTCRAPAPGNRPASRMPPNPTTRFIIADKLLLMPIGTTGIRATIVDGASHPDLPIAVTGKGESSPCSENYFRVSAPAKFTLPAKQIFAIELLIAPSQTGKAVGRFNPIHFTLLTTDKDHPELKSSAPSE